MANAEIDSWLRNTNSFSDGLKLYRKYGENQVLLSLFETVQNDSTREMLEEQLEQISAAYKEKPSKNKPVPAHKQKRFTPHVVDAKYASYPEEVKKLIAEKDALFKEFSHMHSRLMEYDVISPGHSGYELIVSYNNYQNEDDAGADALRLLVLEDRLKKYWNDLDYFENHGKLPEKITAAPKEMSATEAVKRRNTLRTYLSRNPESKNAGAWKQEQEEIERKYDL